MGLQPAQTTSTRCFADEEIQAIEATFPGKLHDYLSVTFGINITLKNS